MGILVLPEPHRNGCQAIRNRASGEALATRGGTPQQTEYPMLNPRTTMLLALAVVIGGTAAAQEVTQLHVGRTAEIGEYLTDGSGRPLYVFTANKTEGEDATISCVSEACTNAWPPAIASGEPEAIGAVDPSLVGTMEHAGQTVVTYDGWPLYHFWDDEDAEEPNGNQIQSFDGQWYLLRPSGLRIE